MEGFEKNHLCIFFSKYATRMPRRSRRQRRSRSRSSRKRSLATRHRLSSSFRGDPPTPPTPTTPPADCIVKDMTVDFLTDEINRVVGTQEAARNSAEEMARNVVENVASQMEEVMLKISAGETAREAVKKVREQRQRTNSACNATQMTRGMAGCLTDEQLEELLQNWGGSVKGWSDGRPLRIFTDKPPRGGALTPQPIRSDPKRPDNGPSLR